MYELEHAFCYLEQYEYEEICTTLMDHGCTDIDGLTRLELAQIAVDLMAEDPEIYIFWRV